MPVNPQRNPGGNCEEDDPKSGTWKRKGRKENQNVGISAWITLPTQVKLMSIAGMLSAFFTVFLSRAAPIAGFVANSLHFVKRSTCGICRNSLNLSANENYGPYFALCNELQLKSRETQTMLKPLFTLAAAFLLATSFNVHATVITPDSGWKIDQFAPGSSPGDPSFFSAWEFTITKQSWFRVTDAFASGDIYDVEDAGLGNLFQTVMFSGTPFNDTPPTPAANLGWSDFNNTSGQVLLSPGSYQITVDLVQLASGFNTAAFYVRLDTEAPEPATSALLALGLLGAGAASRAGRSRRAAR